MGRRMRLAVLAAGLWAAAAAAAPRVAMLADLAADLAEARRLGAPVVLVFTSPGCVYCMRLEAEQLVPMLLSGEYEGRILLRKIDITSGDPVVDAAGRRVPARAIAARYRVALTPTTLLLGPDGEPLGEPLLGYNGEMFAYYLDKAIERGRARIAERLAAGCAEAAAYC
ncbi:thioredoxin family protein [Inmirania thermothiophila]|uniref:Thioredoxin-related protein n=1 Tax=Inmirania thermothiophila TaxID=1750597 RepID=A0A3N1YAH9_9GAMM|nr:thioredoxin family protein [Inmirania thermothiophila]ROR34397.1 thioredoxin-related protein [Inmirania thermothiophila]